MNLLHVFLVIVLPSLAYSAVSLALAPACAKWLLLDKDADLIDYGTALLVAFGWSIWASVMVLGWLSKRWIKPKMKW